jgi:serine/threonine protein kinase/tetratricopeptide (TPR) repeat protein
MNPEAQRVRDVFIAAVKLPPDQWEAFLKETCAADEELRRQVNDLLLEHQEAGSFLDLPAVPLLATEDFDSGANGAVRGVPDPAPATPEGPGTTIGPYKLLELIGEGGMGTVWMAEQREPVQRKVALKIIKAGMDTSQVVARFEAERQALAIMDHPNIATVFDGGATSLGRPYFVMELVKGMPITKYCDEHRLTPRERLELFLPVCHAIQHAHQKGIIHRDVKPANILVAPYDGRPVPKIIDFGVAKATGQRLTERTLFTGFGAVIGTLEYMSPEQAELNNQDIDTRSDIYSLGVLLYELLTGTTPLTRDRQKQAAFTEMLRLIREEEPPKPSTRLSESKETLPSISAQRHMEPAKLTKLVRGELDWIVMKCLEKDRNRRYETANGLAADVQHYLADEPVQACPPSTWYRIRKFARRKKAGLAIAGLVLLLVVLLGGGGGWLVGDRAARQREAEGKVLEALEAAEPRLREGHPWDSALLSAAQRVEAQLDSGILGPRVRRRAEQFRRDVRMLGDLDEIRLRQAESKDKEMWDSAGTEARYEAAFWAYGIDVVVLEPSGAADRVRDSAIREALVAGLDAWIQVRTLQDARRARLRAVADAADESPWRRSFREATLAKDARQLKGLAGQAEALAQPPTVLAWLGSVLAEANLWNEAETMLRQAQERYPEDFWINYNLGHLLVFCPRPQHPDEALGYLRAAVAIRPNSPEARSMLGLALLSKGDTGAAITACQQALALNPLFTIARTNLARARAFAFEAKSQQEERVGRLPEAEQACREARAVWEELAAQANDPDNRWHLACSVETLGVVVERRGRLPEAEQAYRSALALWEALVAESDASDSRWHLAGCRERVGQLYRKTGRLADAEQAYRTATPLWEKLAAESYQPADSQMHLSWNYQGLAEILLLQGKHAEAAKVAGKICDALPKGANGYQSAALVLARCMALADKDSKLPETDRKAVAQAYADRARELMQEAARRGPDTASARELREALRLRLDDPQAHCKLGTALSKQEMHAEAESEFREAVRLRPDFPEARAKLGYALWKQGKNVEAEAECREALRLRPGDPEAYFTLGLVLYWGGEKPAAAARFYAEAFAAHPKLADDVRLLNRYNAACSAARAGCGQGKDAATLDDAERAQLRRQALDWLRADLAAWGQLLDKEPEKARARVQQQLRYWQQDADFAGVRGDALAKLPEAESREWQQLWADVEQTLNKIDAQDSNGPRAKAGGT